MDLMWAGHKSKRCPRAACTALSARRGGSDQCWQQRRRRDPLLSRAAEIYRQNLADAGVEGAEHAVPPSQRPLARTSFHVAVSPEGEPVGVVRAALGTIEQLGIADLIDTDKRHGADSLIASVDPMTLDIFREEYGIMFRALGPVQDHLGFDAVPVGEELTTLESGLRIHRPDFYGFLTEPFTDNERNRFGIPPVAAASV